ncbi:MAG: DbpA RNA binding domain-containing protein [Treponema sp.]|nr:DbpA RNA binding domain-containing protein [Treponema sp.]
MSSQIDNEKVEKNLTRILEKIRVEADPQILSVYRSLFKKKVSLFNRSWAAAYLLMLYDQGNSNSDRNERFHGRKFRKSRDESWNEDERKPYPLSDEESKRLFMSIGRNRRVFPREILGLITTKTDVKREDVGAIRILDNYSFVQVRDIVADGIIEALNGKLFRGRPLTVNYARSRLDSEDSQNDDEAGSYPDTDDGYDDQSSKSEQEDDNADKEGI